MAEQRGQIDRPRTANERILNEEIRRACLFERAKRQLTRELIQQFNIEFSEVTDIIETHFMRISRTNLTEQQIRERIERAESAILREVQAFMESVRRTTVDSAREMAEAEADSNRFFMLGLFSETGLTDPLNVSETTSLATIQRGQQIERTGRAPADTRTQRAGRIGPRTARPVARIPIAINFPSRTDINNIVRDLSIMGTPISQEIDGLSTQIRNRAISDIQTTLRDNQGISGLRTRRRSARRRIANRISTVLRTGLQEAFITVKDTFLRRNREGFSRYMWVSVLDNRTSAVCISRSGVVYQTERGPLPPAHFSCRSSISPIMNPDLTRNADNPTFNGFAPEPITYSNFLRSITSAEQDAILGPTRGRLFRSGQLDLSQLVNRVGGELSIQQLRETLGI